MKKLLVMLSLLGLVAGVAGAYTETLPPASATGVVPVSNGYDWSVSSGTTAPLIQIPIKTAAQIIAYTPVGVGQEVFCSNCTMGFVCISTGTGVGALVVTSTGTTMCR